MSNVYVYAASGRFTGGEFQWNSPMPGGKHEFMLFLKQDKDEPMQREALAEIRRFGFADVKFVAQGRELVLDNLDSPTLGNFRKNHADAMRDGSSIAWYP